MGRGLSLLRALVSRAAAPRAGTLAVHRQRLLSPPAGPRPFGFRAVSGLAAGALDYPSRYRQSGFEARRRAIGVCHIAAGMPESALSVARWIIQSASGKA